MIDRYKHAKERFLKRFGRTIETEQIQGMEELVRLNKVVSMSATPNPDRIMAALRIGEELFHVIYSKVTGDIITFIDINENKHRYKKRKLVKNGNRRPRCRR